MGFYNDWLLPWCIDRSCGMKALAPERAKLAAELHGQVLEVGFGSGLNLPFMPATVTQVWAVEPSARARELAQQRIARATCPVQLVGLEADVIQLDDASVDSALSTFTLCTIPAIERALAEIRRVLKPNGKLHVLEHGRAPDPGVARWQDRLNGMQKTIAGGCNLNRDIPSLLERAGFDARGLTRSYFAEMPRTHGYLFSGTVTRS